MEINKNLLTIIVLVVVGGGIWFVSGQASNKDTQPATSQQTSQAPEKVNIRELKVGQEAPDFNIATVDGDTLTMSGFKNKVVVITSGAAWCPTCMIENKNFQPVYEEVKDKGVEFITVDIDPSDTPEAVLEFQEAYAPWHNVHVDTARQMINDYGFWRFEITYVIDGDGRIQFVDLGITSTEKLGEEINKLI